MPSAGSRLTGAVSGLSSGGVGGDAVLVASPVRKQRLSRNKQELAKEAARIIHQVDQLDSVATDIGRDPTKFYTLPTRKRQKDIPDLYSASLDRKSRKKVISDLNKESPPISTPPKKPPRTFAQISPSKPPVFDIFKKPEQSKNSLKVRRSASDASSLRSKAYSGKNDLNNDFDSYRFHIRNKKQLSPIIEVNPREDYFTDAENKENNNLEANKHVDANDLVKPPSRKKKNHSRENIIEIFKDTEDTHKDSKPPEVVIIDLDKATKISKPNLIKEKFNKGVKKLLSGKVKPKQNKQTVANLNTSLTAAAKPQPKPAQKLPTTLPKAQKKHHVTEKYHTAPRIKSVIASLENPSKRSPVMIHSSQQPVDKLPLTKGRTVDSMVKRLSHESTSPPPKTNIMIGPTVSMQHNNNQPFSYIRGPSPDRSPTNPNSPVIYAQVVCNNNGLGNKQTIHTVYTNGKKHLPHSDSDEGLGYDEFSRKFESNNKTANFGDEYYNDDLVEFPITPKYNSNVSYNGFTSYESNNKYRNDAGNYIDSSSRGRGDGMDAKRRESLTEQIIEANNNQFGDSKGPRKDLSARRELLESRINRRFTDKHIKDSPGTNVYTSETTSRYHRSGSASPVALKDKYTSESRVNYNGDQYTTTQHTTKYIGDQKKTYNRYNYDYEPKSFDSQVSDYRSSPENRHFEASQDYRNKYTSKQDSSNVVTDTRDYYKSSPDLRNDYKTTNFDRTDSERKDKFGDSGIENDFRRDSGDNFKRPTKQRRDTCNDSEDEGFASSLLIASERQHTEDSLAKKKREYEAERSYRRNEGDDPYRHIEGMDRYEYAPRERSIDDGSHFDPRLDRDLSNGHTLQKIDKKPPKPAKRSSLERVKQLFTRDGKKKKEKAGMVREESLRARYSEYKGGPLMEGKYLRKSTNDLTNEQEQNGRRRLATPSPTRQGAGSDGSSRNGKPVTTGTRVTTITTGTHSSWFKSLDRLARKKTKKGEKDGNFTSTEDERGPITSSNSNTKPTKSLRFFGDTDIESSNDSARYDPQGSNQPNRKSALKSRHGSSQHSLSSLGREQRARSQSSRELHNISEEAQHNQHAQTPYRGGSHQRNHKSMMNIASSGSDMKGSRTSLKPPKSPSHMTRDLTPRRGDERRDNATRLGAFRRKNEVSSVESSTEGDSSQQSQRSVVYLHAATVGDIPGPGYLRNGRRAASREDIASNSSRLIQPQTKTLSRSFSVLAPWKPKHYRESMDIDYTQYPNNQQSSRSVKNGKYEQRVPKNGSSRKENSSTTLKKKAQETRRSQQSLSTLNRRSRSKENVSGTLKRASDSKGSSSSLYKKKERQPKENTRYNSRDEKKLSAKSMSVESLGSGSNRTGRRSREENRDVSRSVSMPRNPEKSAGWFNMSRKNNKKSSSAHRL